MILHHEKPNITLQTHLYKHILPTPPHLCLLVTHYLSMLQTNPHLMSWSQQAICLLGTSIFCSFSLSLSLSPCTFFFFLLSFLLCQSYLLLYLTTATLLLPIYCPPILLHPIPFLSFVCFHNTKWEQCSSLNSPTYSQYSSSPYCLLHISLKVILLCIYRVWLPRKPRKMGAFLESTHACELEYSKSSKFSPSSNNFLLGALALNQFFL